MIKVTLKAPFSVRRQCFLCSLHILRTFRTDAQEPEEAVPKCEHVLIISFYLKWVGHSLGLGLRFAILNISITISALKLQKKYP